MTNEIDPMDKEVTEAVARASHVLDVGERRQGDYVPAYGLRVADLRTLLKAIEAYRRAAPSGSFDFVAIYKEARERFVKDATNPICIDETIAKVAFEHGSRASPPPADERLREALTPSADTKAAYLGEFKMRHLTVDEFGDEHWCNLTIPWDQIKEIMAAIRARAAISEQEGKEAAPPPARPSAGVEDLQKRLARYEGVRAGSWFYPEGDTSSDACCFSPEEVLDERYLNFQPLKTGVYKVERAVALPDLYGAVRIYSEAEKDARDLDDDYDVTWHLSEEEARAALKDTSPNKETSI